MRFLPVRRRPFRLPSAGKRRRRAQPPDIEWIRTGNPIASTAACSLVVVRPPRERPIARDRAHTHIDERRLGVVYHDRARDWSRRGRR